MYKQILTGGWLRQASRRDNSYVLVRLQLVLASIEVSASLFLDYFIPFWGVGGWVGREVIAWVASVLLWVGWGDRSTPMQMGLVGVTFDLLTGFFIQYRFFKIIVCKVGHSKAHVLSLHLPAHLYPLTYTHEVVITGVQAPCIWLQFHKAPCLTLTLLGPFMLMKLLCFKKTRRYSICSVCFRQTVRLFHVRRCTNGGLLWGQQVVMDQLLSCTSFSPDLFLIRIFNIELASGMHSSGNVPASFNISSWG